MFCKNCGKQIYENAGVCPHCGVSLNKSVSSDMQIYSQKPRANKNKSVIIVSVVCVLLVVIIVAVVAFFMGKKLNEKDVSDNSNEKSVNTNEYVKPTPSDKFEINELEIDEREIIAVSGHFSEPYSFGGIHFNDKSSSFFLDGRVCNKILAMLNDSLSKEDYAYVIPQYIEDEKIAEIVKDETIFRFSYEDYQQISFNNTCFNYNEVVFVVTGEHKDKLFLKADERYITYFDVIVVNKKVECLSDRIYDIMLNEIN